MDQHAQPRFSQAGFQVLINAAAHPFELAICDNCSISYATPTIAPSDKLSLIPIDSCKAIQCNASDSKVQAADLSLAQRGNCVMSNRDTQREDKRENVEVGGGVEGGGGGGWWVQQTWLASCHRQMHL